MAQVRNLEQFSVLYCYHDCQCRIDINLGFMSEIHLWVGFVRYPQLKRIYSYRNFSINLHFKNIQMEVICFANQKTGKYHSMSGEIHYLGAAVTFYLQYRLTRTHRQTYRCISWTSKETPSLLDKLQGLITIDESNGCENHLHVSHIAMCMHLKDVLIFSNILFANWYHHWGQEI